MTLHIPIIALWWAGNIAGIVAQCVLVELSPVQRWIGRYRFGIGVYLIFGTMCAAPLTVVATNGQPWALTWFAQSVMLSFLIMFGDGNEW